MCGKPMERENIQSTTVGNSFATTYCLTEEVSDRIVIVARSREGVVFLGCEGC